MPGKRGKAPLRALGIVRRTRATAKWTSHPRELPPRLCSLAGFGSIVAVQPTALTRFHELAQSESSSAEDGEEQS
ncbi:hypothetical protein GCM10010423_29190 [Streptomyces levis]|uniref:Uncharacterized protein n=1 Tax=Streptomyces levis TaxID=285566 RepID=A0ABN3NQZ4_9ACTN